MLHSAVLHASPKIAPPGYGGTVRCSPVCAGAPVREGCGGQLQAEPHEPVREPEHPEDPGCERPQEHGVLLRQEGCVRVHAAWLKAQVLGSWNGKPGNASTHALDPIPD